MSRFTGVNTNKHRTQHRMQCKRMDIKNTLLTYIIKIKIDNILL